MIWELYNHDNYMNKWRRQMSMMEEMLNSVKVTLKVWHDQTSLNILNLLKGNLFS